jgi:hypothetical protein
MAPKIDIAPWIDVLGVLASVAKSVPVLGAPVEGSIEALNTVKCKGDGIHTVAGWNDEIQPVELQSTRVSTAQLPASR